MATQQHTPGPWTVEDPLGPEALWIVEGGKEPHEWRCIAMVCRDDLDDHNDLDLPIGAGEQQANARLIAAAPETAAERDRLASRVRQLEHVIERTREVIIDHFDDGCGECANAVALIDMAIAKAEGR